MGTQKNLQADEQSAAETFKVNSVEPMDEDESHNFDLLKYVDNFDDREFYNGKFLIKAYDLEFRNIHAEDLMEEIRFCQDLLIKSNFDSKAPELKPKEDSNYQNNEDYDQNMKDDNQNREDDKVDDKNSKGKVCPYEQNSNNPENFKPTTIESSFLNGSLIDHNYA